MSIREDAISDILAATSSEVLGQDLVIDGDIISAVVKSLTVEEMASHGFDGISMEATRMTLSVESLGYIPRRKQVFDVDGVEWGTHAVAVNGDRLRLTLTRYIS